MAQKITQWPPYQVTSLGRILDSLAEVVRDDGDHLSEESRGWLARLLVVRATGYLEQAILECARGHIDGKSGGLVRTFATSWLDKARNPSPNNILELVGRFDQQLRDDFEAFLDDNDEHFKRELSYLVVTRNSIAHGLNEGIGPRRALALVDVSKKIADWFVLRFNPLR